MRGHHAASEQLSPNVCERFRGSCWNLTLQVCTTGAGISGVFKTSGLVTILNESYTRCKLEIWTRTDLILWRVCRVVWYKKPCESSQLHAWTVDPSSRIRIAPFGLLTRRHARGSMQLLSPLLLSSIHHVNVAHLPTVLPPHAYIYRYTSDLVMERSASSLAQPHVRMSWTRSSPRRPSSRCSSSSSPSRSSSSATCSALASPRWPRREASAQSCWARCRSRYTARRTTSGCWSARCAWPGSRTGSRRGSCPAAATGSTPGASTHGWRPAPLARSAGSPSTASPTRLRRRVPLPSGTCWRGEPDL